MLSPDIDADARIPEPAAEAGLYHRSFFMIAADDAVRLHAIDEPFFGFPDNIPAQAAEIAGVCDGPAPNIGDDGGNSGGSSKRILDFLNLIQVEKGFKGWNSRL